MFIEMKVSGLTMDPITNTPIVILKDLEEKKAIPIWIGIFEASAIATEIEKISFSRPMTHDLLNEILKVLKVEVTRCPSGRRLDLRRGPGDRKVPECRFRDEDDRSGPAEEGKTLGVP
jgi:hypothetical protein